MKNNNNKKHPPQPLQPLSPEKARKNSIQTAKSGFAEIPEWIDTVKKIQSKRFEKRVKKNHIFLLIFFKLNDILVVKCQRIIRNYLNRKRLTKLRSIVLEYKRSPLSHDLRKRHKLWLEIIETEKSYLGNSNRNI